MGKASSAKKVARAARAGGSRRAGQRRALGFPTAVALVIVVGLLLILFARDRRNANAFPRANHDHVHSAIDVYTCVEDKAAETTPDSTTTTTAPTNTTQLASGDVHGEFQPGLTDVKADALGIHSHGDGLMHIHPFTSAAAGRNATMGVFLDQVGVSITDTTLTLPGGTFTEGTTKCEGGKDGVVQVAKWDKASDAAKGDKPNQIFTSGFDKIRLSQNQAYMIAFMPEGSTLKAKSDVVDRIAKVSDLPQSNSSSSAPAESTSTTTATSSSSSSSSP
jgi:hypothetical protein